MAEQRDIQNEQATGSSPAESAAKQRKRAGGPSVSTIVAVLVLIGGIGLLVYPTFSDWWNSYHQSRAIASYVKAVEETDPEVLAKMMSDAREYNERLATDAGRWNMSPAEESEYKSLLDPTGSGVMGYVQISSIKVDYPIYHGMDEGVLQVAIGHLEGSSLPIGGESTHSVISGHRGLPSARLFTDLDKLVEGDTFTITVLNETITYEIDQIRVVLPEDLSNLNIEEGKDYCTLVTCTPYGVNTHRMLVRGHRIPNLDGTEALTADAVQIPRYIAITAVGVPMLFVFLVGMLVYYRVRRPQFDKDQVAEALHSGVRAANGDKIEGR